MIPLLLAIAVAGASSVKQDVAAVPHRDEARTVHYTVTIPAPATHRFHVRMEFANVTGGPVSLCIPAWTPGYYQILNYDKGIEAFKAVDDQGTALPIAHSERRTWTIKEPAEPGTKTTVEYDVRATDGGYGFFYTALHPDLNEGYINGACAFMYLKDRKTDPAELTVTPPADWNEACALARDQDQAEPAKITHTYHAADYDELIDSPIQLGKFDEIDLEVNAIPVRFVIVGARAADLGAVVDQIARVAATEIRMFGSAPFHQYTFFYHFGGSDFGGGLEHRNSTVIHLDRPSGPGDESMLRVSAHEFFHAWNVKWLHPEGLGPFDYTQPVRTPSLWWAEGVTDYYALIALVRAGLRDRQWFLATMSMRLQDLQSTPSRYTVTLEQASARAWEGGSEGYAGLSYYLKGSLVGFYFDMRLRTQTNGTRSLDDVMKYLCEHYAARGVGYPDNAILEALDSLSPVPVDREYHLYVRGTADIDWSNVVVASGLTIQPKTASDPGPQLQDLPTSAAEPSAVAIRDGLFHTDLPAAKQP
jgi:predicted metalloprotease with PDZ domain